MPSPLKRANSVAFESVFNRLSILACDFESQAGLSAQSAALLDGLLREIIG